MVQRYHSEGHANGRLRFLAMTIAIRLSRGNKVSVLGKESPRATRRQLQLGEDKEHKLSFKDNKISISCFLLSTQIFCPLVQANGKDAKRIAQCTKIILITLKRNTNARKQQCHFNRMEEKKRKLEQGTTHMWITEKNYGHVDGEFTRSEGQCTRISSTQRNHQKTCS